MKPTTKGFLLGVLTGAVLMVAVQILGLLGIGLWARSDSGRSWVADKTLRSPEYPAIGALPALGQADYDWELQTLEGVDVPFSDFRGKTVFLNVWGTWCPPCVMEMPSIERLRQSLDSSDVAFVIVSEEHPHSVTAFLERNPLDLPLYVVKELPEAFATSSVPTTFIIDPDGNVVFTHRSAAKWDDVASETFLKSLGG
jgi:thiol-disulfide isomerase/thioredoxin